MTSETPAPGDLIIRELAAEEWTAWYHALDVAFGEVEAPEEIALWHELTELGRSLGVWDGETPVGGASAFSFRLAVPGGAMVPAAGVTMVGVLPTHRRRGVLTALMRRQLDDVRARGEALAVLTASETGIYGRYGYGLGTWNISVTIPRARVTVLSPGGTPVRLRLADPVTASPACEELYAERVPLRPGMLERSPGWEKVPLLDPPGSRGGFTPLQCVLAEEPGSGRLLGYSRYRVRAGWTESGIPNGAVEVRDIEAADPAVYAELLRYLLALDLNETVHLRTRPTDDPVLQLVSDPRRLEPQLKDSLYVRLVEVGRALEQRGYAQPVDVVLDVTDEFCPWNAGRWRLLAEGPGKGVSCDRTTDAADLALDVRALGSAYLGGTTLAALAAAGLVTELREGALTQASRAFASDIAPWLPHGF